MPNKAPKKKAEEKPVAKRARKMPLTGPQAEAAIQALRDDAGSAAFRKKQSAKKMMAGGKTRGYGMARGGKACKMM